MVKVLGAAEVKLKVQMMRRMIAFVILRGILHSVGSIEQNWRQLGRILTRTLLLTEENMLMTQEE